MPFKSDRLANDDMNFLWWLCGDMTMISGFVVRGVCKMYKLLEIWSEG